MSVTLRHFFQGDGWEMGTRLLLCDTEPGEKKRLFAFIHIVLVAFFLYYLVKKKNLNS